MVTLPASLILFFTTHRHAVRGGLLDEGPDHGGDGRAEELLGQVQNVLRNGFAAKELGHDVGEVVAVVVEEVITVAAKLLLPESVKVVTEGVQVQVGLAQLFNL